jgi:hypothetical protein
MSKMAIPGYVFSGKKGLSNVDNARHHISGEYFVTADVASFYRSSRREYVFRFFCYDLAMAQDVAHLLARICCYDDYIPTGSPLSQTLAYLSYRGMFDELHALAERSGALFSLYVDDMTFSSSAPFPRAFHLEVDSILKRRQLSLKRRKVRYFGKRQAKLVTGCIVTSDHCLRIPNRRRKAIINDLMLYRGASDDNKTYSRLMGRIGSAQQIERDAFRDSKSQAKALHSRVAATR